MEGNEKILIFTQNWDLPPDSKTRPNNPDRLLNEWSVLSLCVEIRMPLPLSFLLLCTCSPPLPLPLLALSFSSFISFTVDSSFCLLMIYVCMLVVSDFAQNRRKIWNQKGFKEGFFRRYSSTHFYFDFNMDWPCICWISNLKHVFKYVNV